MLELRKDIFADERDDAGLKEAGTGTQRQDMLAHVTGTPRYFDDHLPAGTLHLKVLRSPHLHARIRGIDAYAAERAPGVRRVIRAADVPRNLNTLLSLINFGKDDEPTLAEGKVRYRGEPVVAVRLHHAGERARPAAVHDESVRALVGLDAEGAQVGDHGRDPVALLHAQLGGAASMVNVSVGAWPVSPTSLTPEPTCWVDAEISPLISRAASAERWASARTSDATTAKPRPASPARAAPVMAKLTRAETAQATRADLGW